MIQRTVDFGPIHTALPGVMKLSLGLSGDRVENTHAEFGYTSRGIEQSVLGQHFSQAQLRISRLEPESALLVDTIFSEAIEELTGTEISNTAEWIREISVKLGELNLHFKYLARVAHRLGIEVLFHKLLKHRESILDLLELLTGSRFGYFYISPGGVRYDLTEGFQERLEAWAKTFHEDYPRILALFCWTHPFHNRLKAMGRVIDDGKYGFVSKSSVGMSMLGSVSHVESRILGALLYTKEAASYLGETLGKRPSAEELKVQLGKQSSDKCRVEMETGRGLLALSLHLNVEGKLKSIKFDTPSDLIKESIGMALDGESVEDVPVILESLFLTVGEIDR